MAPQAPRTIYRHRAGRLRAHTLIDGRVLPVIAGGDDTGTVTDPPDLDSLTTVDELTVERARTLDSIDNLLDTVRERAGEGEQPAMTDEETAEHAALVSRFDAVTDKLAAATRADETDQAIRGNIRRHGVAVPMVNRLSSTPSPSADRNLDELLWATNETVAAGSVSRSGSFEPSGAVAHVDAPVITRADGLVGDAPRLAEWTPEHRAVIRRFQQTVADMLTFGAMFGGRTRNISQAEAWDVARSHPLFADRWTTILRAMDVDTSAEGTDWVPTGFGATIHEKVRASGKVAPLFMSINLPTNPWKWPLEGADATAYRVAEPTGGTEPKFTASTPGTGAATFDAEIIGSRVLFSRSLEADSIISVTPYVQNKIAQAFADAIETAIINGDSDGTHQDADIGASTSAAQTLWDGLRKRALANASASHSNAALTVAGLRNTRELMGKWGVNPASLAFIVGLRNYFQLLEDTTITTVDKFGPNAVLLNGQVGALDGIPVIISEHVREDVNASGVEDGVTTDRSFALCVNRGEFVMGNRENLMVEVDDSIYRETYQRVLVGFARSDFQNIGDASTNDDVAILYNVA